MDIKVQKNHLEAMTQNVTKNIDQINLAQYELEAALNHSIIGLEKIPISDVKSIMAVFENQLTQIVSSQNETFIGIYLLDALILASINQLYDNRLFIELHRIQVQHMLCAQIVLFLTFKTICVHNMC